MTTPAGDADNVRRGARDTRPPGWHADYALGAAERTGGAGRTGARPRQEDLESEVPSFGDNEGSHLTETRLGHTSRAGSIAPSNRSGGTSTSHASSVRRHRLEAQLRAAREIAKLEEEAEEAEVEAAKLATAAAAAVAAARKKLERNKDLVQRQLQIETLEEETEYDDCLSRVSQRLSDDDEKTSRKKYTLPTPESVKTADLNERLLKLKGQPEAPKCKPLENADDTGAWVDSLPDTKGNNRDVKVPTEGKRDPPETVKTSMPSVVPKDSLDKVLSNQNKMFARQSTEKDLPEFDGSPQLWLDFISVFRTTTEDCKYTDGENMGRLRKCLKGKARDTVCSMWMVPENLEDLLEMLELNFGQPHRIMEIVIDEARKAPIVKEGTLHGILDLANKVRNLACTLRRLKKSGHMLNPDLMRELSRKLPSNLRLMWNEEWQKNPEYTLNDFSVWMTARAKGASLDSEPPTTEETKSRQEKTRGNDRRGRQDFRRKEVVCAATEGRNTDSAPVARTWEKTKECWFCDEDSHSVVQCDKFLHISYEDKIISIRGKGVCFRCLKVGHMVPNCTSKERCGVSECKGLHHKLIHQERKKTPVVEKALPVNHATSKTDFTQVFLPVIAVYLRGPAGEFLTWALLDSGAAVSLLDEAMAVKLGLQGVMDPLYFKGIGDSKGQDNNSRRVTLSIRGAKCGISHKIKDIRTVTNLNLETQSMDVEDLKKKWKHLDLVDADSFKNATPTILLGVKHAFLTAGLKSVCGTIEAPIAAWTNLGWVIYGVSPRSQAVVNAEFVSHITISREANKRKGEEKKEVAEENAQFVGHLSRREMDEELHEMMKDWWKTDTFGVKVCSSQRLSSEDSRMIETCDTTTQRIGSRWETGLPWRSNEAYLPESKRMVKNRLNGLEKKLDKDLALGKRYCEKIDEYVSKGYARKLSLEEANFVGPKTWYLPHFAAINPNKPAKIRLVFDAAAKANGVCLNDALMKGPDLMSPLITVMCKFRQCKVAFSADIKEMFHQVKIRNEDTTAQRFLWRGMDRDREPDVMQMSVMIFGAVSSPCQAQYVKNRNALEFQSEFPEAVTAITQRHYVDDYLDSAPTDDVSIKRIKEVIDLHRRGGFEITNFICNSPAVMDQIPSNLRADGGKDMSSDDGSHVERVLGLRWNPEDDEFLFVCSFSRVSSDIIEGLKRPTKREVLRLVMSLFDPLGFVAHFIIRAKILLQHIWRSEIGWDDELTTELMGKWCAWLEELHHIDSMRIPRCYSYRMTDAVSVELHVFCDASEKAFATVAYWRVDTGENIETAFVMAKTRVAPLKPLSIPRLELQAAVMGTRLTETIVSQHDMTINGVHFWSDSSTVLKWIRADGRRYKPFVAHRVGEIQEAASVNQWHWLPTDENVADEATRDAEGSDLRPSSRWLNGPLFLKEDKSRWPKEQRSPTSDEDPEDIEMKRDFISNIIESKDLVIPKLSHLPTWMKLVRATAWMRRFVRRMKQRTGTPKKTICVLGVPELTVPEITAAEETLLKHAQSEMFGEEIRTLGNGKEVLKTSRIYKLLPMLNDKGLLVVRGRLEQLLLLNENAKQPIILDRKHDVTNLIVHHYHCEAGHHGQERILNELRQKYWVIKMRAAVKSALNSCQECKIDRAKPSHPEMGTLPVERGTGYVQPFTHTGLDYFGPMEVTIGRRHEKRYGALFTCMATRAIHLEIAASLSTDSAIMAIRRFVARRGKPKTIRYDNGTNFKGANNELKKAVRELDQSVLVSTLASLGIEWHFIPPSAPHMGGIWERKVKSVKIALAATLKSRAPKEEVLQTLFAEAENTVNSHPLTRVSGDPDDQESLTPNHFLLGSSNGIPGPGVFSDSDLWLRKNWRQSQRLADIFWKRWVKEYLPPLPRGQSGMNGQCLSKWEISCSSRMETLQETHGREEG